MISSTNALVFIHGLGGDAEMTWRNFASLIQLDKELSPYSVHYFKYPTTIFRLPFFKKSLRIQDLSLGLETLLASLRRNHDKIIVVAHSLGGLIARFSLLADIKNNKEPSFDALLLYGTPNTGAALADIGQYLSWRQSHLKQMCVASDFLDLLNRDWNSLRPRIGIPVCYVVGGQDRVVTIDSAGPVFGAGSIKLIADCDHLSLIRPKNENDIAFRIFKNFVQDCCTASVNLIKESYLQKGEGLVSGNTADVNIIKKVLFGVYSIECEPYYINRDADRTLRAALASSTVWVSGASGVGKTAAITRHLIISKQQFHYINLAPYAKMPTKDLLKAIYEQLCEKFQVLPIPVDALPDIIRQISNTLRSTPMQKFYLFVEEIPSTNLEHFLEFIEVIYQLIIVHTAQSTGTETYFVLSSIFSVSQLIGEHSLKLRERIEFIEFVLWDEIELLALLNLIVESLSLQMSQENKIEAVGAASGSPRFIKILMRALSRTPNNFDLALQKTRGELSR